MKLMMALMASLTLVACSTTKEFESRTESKDIRTVETKTTTKGDGTAVMPTLPDFEVRAMNRTEVIAAIDQCHENGMKPFVEYLSQKTPYGRVMAPVNVHCNPNRKPVQ